jgi:Tfp pilus assembly protein PilX
MTPSCERGIAMIVALFMVLVLSTLGSSLIFVSQTDTWSTANYRLTAQARYAAESGVQQAAHHLMYGYTPPGTAIDPLATYDLTVSPVTFNGTPVVLSSDPGVASNYPVAAVQTAFNLAVQGAFAVQTGTSSYTASATLMSMRQIADPVTGLPTTLQTWQVTGVGGVSGPRGSRVELSAVIDRPVTPLFNNAAFATDNTCAALSFLGNSATNSYDSAAALSGGQPVLSNNNGNVATNGNLHQLNNSVINGSLSTPSSGVGSCTTGAVTAHTVSGNAVLTGGIVQAPQGTTHPTPPAPNPLPPTNNQNFQNCTGLPDCTSSGGVVTITPPSPASVVTFGNINLSGNTEVHLNAGIYIVNSLDIAGNAQVVIDSGPVVFQMAGQGSTQPVQIGGNHGIINPTYDPSMFRIVYGGTGTVVIDGNAEASATVYAPNAAGSIGGNADLYGAIVISQMMVGNNAEIHFDRSLQTSSVTAGNHTMSGFTWRSY